MQFFSETDVHDRLAYDRLIPALIAAHASDIDARASCVLEQPCDAGANHFLALPAWQHDRAIGAKLITSFPGNSEATNGLPTVHGVYVLFSGTDGQPLAVIDGTALTLRKTASDSAMGAHFLARDDAEKLLVVGAGALGPHVIQAHCAARPSIRSIEIWNRTPARAEMLAQTMAQEGLSVVATDDLETAARAADVICCITGATEPLIRGDWLTPGTHLDLIGSFRHDMHECDGAAVRRASVFVDSRWSAVEDCGEIVSALASGDLRPEQILADGFELSRGQHPGRHSPDEITLFKNGGGGHLDLMVAQILCPLESTNGA